MERNLKVVLITHTPFPEGTVALAAKLCYSPSDIEALQEKIDATDQTAFIEKLVKIGHMSPIEHISFTFGIEGISRACSHQLVRHRLASYSQQSQRYVRESEGFDYIIPESIKNRPDLQNNFEHIIGILQRAYKLFTDNDIPAEDARFLLPNAAETKIIMTMNARELLHFFNVRCCNRAQWEIRAMATEMLKLVKKTAPTIFKAAGPSCVKGSCQEGEMTCGKAKEIRQTFSNL